MKQGEKRPHAHPRAPREAEHPAPRRFIVFRGAKPTMNPRGAGGSRPGPHGSPGGAARPGRSGCCPRGRAPSPAAPTDGTRRGHCVPSLRAAHSACVTSRRATPRAPQPRCDVTSPLRGLAERCTVNGRDAAALGHPGQQSDVVTNHSKHFIYRRYRYIYIYLYIFVSAVFLGRIIRSNTLQPMRTLAKYFTL